MRSGQRVVAAASLVVAAGSLVGYVLYRIQDGAVPLWDKVLLAYGIVFCLFLWFDRAAKAVADTRAVRRAAEPVRPRPHPGARPPEQAVLLAADAASTTPHVSLERVLPQLDGEFLDRVGKKYRPSELGALDGMKPSMTASGRVLLAEEAAWRGEARRHPFQIVANGHVVGVCAVEMEPEGEARLLDSVCRSGGAQGVSVMLPQPCNRCVTFCACLG